MVFLRYRNIHLQEPLQKPDHIQLMELRAKTIRWKFRLGVQLRDDCIFTIHIDNVVTNVSQ